MATFQAFLVSPNFHLTMFALVGAAAIQGLVALWAATSRLHWFWRALAVWAAVMALVPIRAYQPALVFAISGPLTVGLVLAGSFAFKRGVARDPVQERSVASPAFRFALCDLFLLVLLVALTIVGVSAIRPAYGWREMAAYVACGAINASIISLAYGSVTRQRWWLAAILLPFAIAAAGLGMFAICGSSPAARLWQPLGLMYASQFSTDEAAVVALAYAELALVITAFTWLCRASCVSQRTASRAIARGSLAALVPFFGAMLALLYWQMLWLSPLPPRFSSETTHYQRIVAIAKRVKSMGPTTSPTAQQEFRGLLDEAVRLLDARNFVPCDPKVDLTPQAFDQRLADVQTFRDLGRTLSAASPPAVTPGDQVQTTRLALANVRLGVMMSRGGTMIDRLVGIAVQGVGLKALAATRAELSPDQSRVVIEALERAAAEREDVALTVARDAAISERVFGWQARLEIVILHLYNMPSAAEQAMREAVRRAIATENLLQADLAIRLFIRDHQRPPESLVELVPKYLPEVPIDPYSQEPLRYRTEEGDFVLHSVGVDGRDNGGRLGNFRQYFQGPGYDYDLDTMTRP